LLAREDAEKETQASEKVLGKVGLLYFHAKKKVNGWKGEDVENGLL